jgi:hypothetical protein
MRYLFALTISVLMASVSQGKYSAPEVEVTPPSEPTIVSPTGVALPTVTPSSTPILVPTPSPTETPTPTAGVSPIGPPTATIIPPMTVPTFPVADPKIFFPGIYAQGDFGGE